MRVHCGPSAPGRAGAPILAVIPGLRPEILTLHGGVDGRDEPGHDGFWFDRRERSHERRSRAPSPLDCFVASLLAKTGCWMALDSPPAIEAPYGCFTSTSMDA